MSIHPTAIVDESATIGDGVEIGAYAIIESDVSVGAGTIIRPHVVIRRYTTLGQENYVDSFSVLGGDPQDYAFDRKQISHLRIGDNNTFREGVTISRATGDGEATLVGNHTYWMANSHAGHNAMVKDRAILPNGALMAGYSELGEGALLGAGGGIHQFTWVGTMAMFQGGACATAHVPPYCIVADMNKVIALNRVGLKRAKDISDEDRRQIRQAFDWTYRSSYSPKKALAAMDQCSDWGEPAGEFREFVRRVIEAEGPYKRPLCRRVPRLKDRH